MLLKFLDPNYTSIAALVVFRPDTGFTTGGLIDALPVFSFGFSPPTRLPHRDPSVVIRMTTSSVGPVGRRTVLNPFSNRRIAEPISVY